MNGIARALNDSFRPVELVGRYDDENGQVTQIIVAETIMVLSQIEAAGVVVSGGADGPSPDPPPAAPRFLSLAMSNPNVAEAVGLMGKPGDLSWVNLYKLYEIVVTDVGDGQAGLIKTGWITKATLSTFTASANHPFAGGSEARHARLPGKGPRSTMTLEEARALITQLVNDWMGSLV